MSKRKIKNEDSSIYFANLKVLIEWYRISYVVAGQLPRAGYDQLTDEINKCDEYENLIGDRYIEKIIANYDRPVSRNKKKIEAIYTFLSDLLNGKRKSEHKPHPNIPSPKLLPLDDEDSVEDTVNKALPESPETKKTNDAFPEPQTMMVDLPQPVVRVHEIASSASRSIKKASDLFLDNCEFIIINKQYNSLLDCLNPDNNLWRVIHWHEWHYHLNQKWIISKVQDSDNAVLFSPKSGLCIEISTRNNLEGFSLTLGEYCGREDQHWKIELLNDWSFKISSANPSLSNYCIDAFVFSETNKILHLHAWHGGDNQRWFLSPCFIEPRFNTEKRVPFNEIRSRDRLERGMELLIGHYLKSKNGKYKLAMQFDGNLVLYDENNTSIWSNDKCGEKVKKCIFQHDGNFVCYDRDRPPYTPKNGIWDSGTHIYGNAHYVKVDDDGFLGIYTDADELLWWKPDEDKK